jgi:hypothetical protein
MLSLRAECSKNDLCGVARLRLRAVFLCSRSRFGLPALATDITRAASWLDLAGIEDWYEAQQVGLGAEFREAVDELFRRIGDNPLACEVLGSVLGSDLCYTL